MNELCKYFNIFEDKDIIDFIKMKGKQDEFLSWLFKIFTDFYR